MEAVSSTKLSYPSDDRVERGERRDGLSNQDDTCTTVLVSVLESIECWHKYLYADPNVYSKLTLTLHTVYLHRLTVLQRAHTQECTLSMTDFFFTSLPCGACGNISSPSFTPPVLLLFMYVCPRL